MPFWTPGKIKTLQDQALEAQGRIADLFEKSRVSLPNNRIGWGQFLGGSKDNTQCGILGTSAGIQVLASSGVSERTELINRALPNLDNLLDKTDADDPFLLDGDLILLFKMTYLAEAKFPGQVNIEADSQIMQAIVARALPGQGWGNYYEDKDDSDPAPTVNATAAALLALYRYEGFQSSKVCLDAVKWLYNRIPQNGNLATHELAIAALALKMYQGMGSKPIDHDFALDLCKKKLIDWARDRKNRRFGTGENYHYNVRLHKRSTMKYMFFLPDYLVAILFLRLGSPKVVRPYVLYVVSRFVDAILKQGGYAPENTKLFASVDHLWIYRLLNEFRSEPAKELAPSGFYQWTGASSLVKILLMIGMLLLGIAGILVGRLGLIGYDHGTTWKSIGLIIIGGLLTTVPLGLLGRMLWEFFVQGKNDYS